VPLKIAHFESPYSAEEVSRRLQAIVRPRHSFLDRLIHVLSTEPYPIVFEGTVTGQRFTIARISKWRNSFPVVRGTVTPRATGAQVRIAMSLHPVIALFMALWICLAAAPMLNGVKPVGNTKVVATLLLFVGVIVQSVGFYVEARKAEKLIRQCVGAA
jgi:hypothetical protein